MEILWCMHIWEKSVTKTILQARYIILRYIDIVEFKNTPSTTHWLLGLWMTWPFKLSRLRLWVQVSSWSSMGTRLTHATSMQCPLQLLSPQAISVTVKLKSPFGRSTNIYIIQLPGGRYQPEQTNSRLSNPTPIPSVTVMASHRLVLNVCRYGHIDMPNFTAASLYIHRALKELRELTQFGFSRVAIFLRSFEIDRYLILVKFGSWIMNLNPILSCIEGTKAGTFWEDAFTTAIFEFSELESANTSFRRQGDDL